MRYLEEHGAYYALRLKAKAFNLYRRNEKGQYVRFDLAEELKDWEEGKTLCFSVFYRQGKDYFPVRVCALGKSAEDIEKGTARVKASNSGKNRGKVSELQSIYNKFIVVVTNLPEEITAGRFWNFTVCAGRLSLFSSVSSPFWTMTNCKRKPTLLPEHGFTANCSQPPFVNFTFNAAFFPPPDTTPGDISRLSLWQAYEVVYDVLTYLLLASFRPDTFFQESEKLRDACADSKRKRTLTLVSFSLQTAFV